VNTTQNLFVLVAVITLSGCAADQIKQTGSASDLAYNRICQTDPKAKTKSLVEATAAPKGSPEEGIAAARLELADALADYKRYTCEMEHRNRSFDYPLLGTALAASAAVLAKANTYVISGLGLTAAGLVTAKSYEHPDTQRDAFLDAYEQLTCLQDETQVLDYNNGNIAKLLADQPLLLSQIGRVNAVVTQAAAKSTDADKAVIKAANAALDAGHKALTQIETAMGDYKNIPTAMNRALHKIDYAGRKASLSHGDYAAFNGTIKSAFAAAAENKANMDAFKKSVAAAQGAASTAAAAQTSGTLPSLKAQQNAQIAFTKSIENHCKPGSTESICQYLAAQNDQLIESVSGREFSLSAIARDSTVDDVTKLINMAGKVADEMPSPAYADITASVAACVPKQQ
jgi:hypothetical protein